MPTWFPKGSDFMREAIIVAGGALIAAVVIRSLPAEYQRWFSLPTAPK